MFLAPYIKELLFTYECVIIPDLGAFITQYIPAVIQADRSMSPPSKIVGFKSDLTEDDGLLVSHLCRRLNLKDVEVRRLINQEKASIIETVAAGNPYVLEEIGVFTQDRDRQLTFTANQETNFHLDSFGLGTFKFPVLEAKSTPFLKNPILFRQPTSSVRESLPGTQSTFKRKHLSPLVLLTAVLVVVFLSLLPDNTRVTDALFRHPAALGPLPSLRELEPDPKLIVPNRETIINPPNQAIQKKQAEIEKVFPVIAGSFESQQNASVLEQQLVRKGYPAQTSLSGQGFYRVEISRFNSLAEAESALFELQKDNPQLALWVLK